MTVPHRMHPWCSIALICALGFSAPSAAEPTTPKDTQILQLFQATYGPEEGRARYEQWRATKDLPLEQYLGEAAPSREAAPAMPQPSAAAPNNVSSPPAPPAVQQPAPDAIADYQLAEGDVLKISVWQWPDLKDDSVIVRPDGKMSFPLIGEVQVMGLTLEQLNQLLTVQLGRYIKNPQVSVAIRETAGRKIIILGEVKTPGVYRMGEAHGGGGSRPTRRATLLEAIALAGGFDDHAQPKHVVVLRGDEHHPHTLVLNLQPALKGKTTFFHDNIIIESEDIIVVPPSFVSKAKEAVGYALSQVGAIATTYLAVDNVKLRRQTSTTTSK